MKKLEKLIGQIKAYEKVIVAFSGGVDSLLLLKVATDSLGVENVLAVTVNSPFSTPEEVESARSLCRNLGVKHQVVDMDELSIPAIADNPPDRCYHCKKTRYQQLLSVKEGTSYQAVLDGTNFSDLGEYRPGMAACEELGIISPLKEVGLTKPEIRKLLQLAGVAQWASPSKSCLATRIPHTEPLTKGRLEKVYHAECFLKSLGFDNLRVRIHGDIARIELPQEDIDRLMKNGRYRRVAAGLKKIGFRFVTLDLEGLRSGSLNPIDNTNERE